MTPERMSEIAARAEAATEGPWQWDPPSEEKWPQGDESLRTAHAPEGEEYPTVVLYGWGYDASGIDATEADRAFIAHARTDIPDLLALVAEKDADHRVTTAALRMANERAERWKQRALDARADLAAARAALAVAWDEGYECAYRIQEKKRGSVTQHGARHLTPPNPYRAALGDGGEA